MGKHKKKNPDYRKNSFDCEKKFSKSFDIHDNNQNILSDQENNVQGNMNSSKKKDKGNRSIPKDSRAKATNIEAGHFTSNKISSTLKDSNKNSSQFKGNDKNYSSQDVLNGNTNNVVVKGSANLGKRKAGTLILWKPSAEKRQRKYNDYSNISSSDDESSTDASVDLSDESLISKESDCDSEDDTSFSSDECEEEEEGDYTPSDEDSTYSYTGQSEEEFIDNNLDLLLNHSSSDTSYEPPSNFVEDLVIHQGTATIRNLLEHEVVEFPTDDGGMKIKEISCETATAAVEQPIGDLKDILSRLKEDIDMEEFAAEQLMSQADDDCPELVPIPIKAAEDDDNGSKCNYLSLMDDESSIVSSVDINSKYSWDQQDSSDSNVDRESEDMISVTQSDMISVGSEQKVLFSGVVEPPKDIMAAVPSDDLFLWKANRKDSAGDEAKVQITSVPIVDDEFASDDASDELEISAQSDLLKASNSYRNPFNASNHGSAPLLSAADSGYGTQVTNEPDVYFYNSYSSRHVVALVKADFYVYGTVNITQLFGQVDIYRYQPKCHQTLSLYSPRGYSAIAIKPVNKVTESQPILMEYLTAVLYLYDIILPPAAMVEIMAEFNQSTDAIIIMEANAQSAALKKIFSKHMNENVFPHVASIPKWRPYYSSECILDCMINLRTDKNLLEIPIQWQQVTLKQKSRLLVAGGKSVGKSTFLRGLANRHLGQSDPGFQRILLVDLDIGQPEVFLPQTVSCTVLEAPLLGPGFLQRLQPRKAFIVGQTNVVLCAYAYMNAVKALLEYCKSTEEFKDLPWLVNTMGYNKGFGLELIKVISAYLQPTDIVQIQSKKEINNFDHWLTVEVLEAAQVNIYADDALIKAGKYTHQHKLHLLNSAVAQQSRYLREWQMSPKDTRYAMLLCRLSCILTSKVDSLNNADTWCCSLENLHWIDLLAVEEKTKLSEDLLKAFNANLVYLCCDSEESCALECIDVGIVCGIDFQQKLIYIKPAVKNSSALGSVNCLSSGEIILPKSMFTKQGLQVEGPISHVQSTNDDSASKAIKQIYYRPPAFLLGKKGNNNEV